MCVVVPALLNRNHGGVGPLLFFIKCFCGQEAKVTWAKKAPRQVPFGLAACYTSELRWWGGGQNEQYAQLLHCVIWSPVIVETDVFHWKSPKFEPFASEISFNIDVVFCSFSGKPISFCLSIICQNQQINNELVRHKLEPHNIEQLGLVFWGFCTVSDWEVESMGGWPLLTLFVLCFPGLIRFLATKKSSQVEGPISCCALSFFVLICLTGSLVTKSWCFAHRLAFYREFSWSRTGLFCFIGNKDRF